MPFNEDGKKSDHHHRWWRLNSTPVHAFEHIKETGENIMRLNNYEGYTELVSSEFRSTWLTNLPEAERPDIRAKLDFGDEDGPVYIPLLKKNYKDNKDNFVRTRTDGLNDTWFHNFAEDEDKREFGLTDHYRDQDTGEEFSDLRVKLPVALEGIDKDGFIEKDGHRFKSSITYDTYKGAFATFQEEYKLKFHTEGGKFSDNKELKEFPVLHGESLGEGLLDEPTRTDYVFKGWRIGNEGQIESFNVNSKVTKNMDIYAVWEKKTDKPDKPNPNNPEQPDQKNPEKPDQKNPDKADQKNPKAPDQRKPNGQNHKKPNGRIDNISQSSKTGKGTPNTGDNSDYMIYVIGMVLGTLAVVAILRKKELD